MNRHIKRLNDCKAIKCLHSRLKCVDAFQFVLKMKFHLQNVHCIDFIKDIKRRRSDSEVKFEPDRRKRSRRTKNHDLNVKLET